MSRIRVALIDDEPELLDQVRALLGKEPDLELVGTGRDGREALLLANRLRPDIMVLDVNMPLVNGIQAAARITNLFPSIGLIMLTTAESPLVVKQAFKAGAKDFLNKREDIPDLARVIREVDQRRDRQAPSRGLASVWSFYGTKGNSGCTTLAVNTAFDLATLGYRVLLMDLDLIHGDCAFQLNLPPGQPGKNLFTALSTMKDLNVDSVKPFLRRFQATGVTPTPLSILESPCTLTPTDAAAGERVAAVLDLVVTQFDHVVIDLPPGLIRDRAVIAAMDLSERVFAVFNREMSALRTMAPFIAMMARGKFPMERLTLLMGSLVQQEGFDYRAWLEPRRPGLAKMGLNEILDVPRDELSCGRALTNGVPVLSANADGTLATFIHELVERALERFPAAAARGEMWGQLRAVLGR